MNRHPRFARRTAGSRNAVSPRLAAIAALLFAATVGAAVQAVDLRSWDRKYDLKEIQLVWELVPHTSLRTGRDADRGCSLYKTVGNRRGWGYSDAGLTPTFRTWCVRGAGESEPF